jgi:hypothetical protein
VRDGVACIVDTIDELFPLSEDCDDPLELSLPAVSTLESTVDDAPLLSKEALPDPASGADEANTR